MNSCDSESEPFTPFSGVYFEAFDVDKQVIQMTMQYGVPPIADWNYMFVNRRVDSIWTDGDHDSVGGRNGAYVPVQSFDGKTIRL